MVEINLSILIQILCLLYLLSFYTLTSYVYRLIRSLDVQYVFGRGVHSGVESLNTFDPKLFLSYLLVPLQCGSTWCSAPPHGRFLSLSLS